MRRWWWTVAAVLVPALAQAAAPVVTASVVDVLPSADVVKVVVFPQVGALRFKKVCGTDAMRIRIAGVALHGAVRPVAVPQGAWLRDVRLVDQGGMVVVKAVARGAQLATCGRTTVDYVDGTVVISVAATEAQARNRAQAILGASTRVDQPAAPVRESTAARGDGEESTVRTEKGGRTSSPTAADADPAAPSPKARAATAAEKAQGGEKESLRGGGGTLFGQRRQSSPAAVAGPQELPWSRYVGAVVFSLLIAGASWWLKKRKAAAGIGDGDAIDILSRKRLGPKHQLLVARVNGEKFLLAVADKTVSALGKIGDGEVPAPALDALQPAPQSASRRPRVNPVNYALIPDDAPKETSPDAPPQGKTAQRAPARHKGDADFEKNFWAAVEKVNARPQQHVHEPLQQAAGAEHAAVDSDVAVPANVAGLLGLTKVRSTIESLAAKKR